MSYLDNKGLIFPLKAITRDGNNEDLTTEKMSLIKDVILDCKIIGAIQNKYYTLDWIGKGHVINGYNRYDIVVTEHDKDTFATSSSTNSRGITFLSTNNFKSLINPSGIQTLQFESIDKNISIILTLDYDAFASYATQSQTYLDMEGMALIIDTNCYIENKEINIIKINFDNGTPTADIFSSKYKFTFKKDNANNIFSWWTTSKKTDSYGIPAIFSDDDDNVESFGISTDLVGPYISYAVNNPDTGYSKCFCGGQHGKDNSINPIVDGKSNATAETKLIDIFVDGTYINSNGIYYGNNIDIYVENYIMSYNTTITERYTHIEYVHFTIHHGKIDVEVTIKPMEHIRVETYYGMQMVRTDYSHIQFLGAHGSNNRVELDSGVESSKKGEYICDTIIMNNNNHNDVLEMHLNREGLGNRQFCDDSLSSVFVASGKVYFRICGFYNNTKSFDMYPNKEYHWSGYWWFKSRR